VRARKLVARIAIAGALLAALAASPNALQGEPAPGSGGAAGQPGNAPQYDPNLPPLAAPNDAPIYWLYQYTSTLPLVYFKSTGAFCVYLGFDEKGSYIQNQGDGNVYLWNLKANGLTVVADNFKDLPLNILASLKNADQTVQYWLAANDKSHGPAPVPQHGGVASGTAATAGQIYKGPQHDPNLQPLIGMNDAPVYWSYGSGTVPSVSFRGYPYSKDPSNQGDGVYLGFNSNGSLILDQGNLKLYYWKLTDPRTFAGTVTLAVALKSFRDVPLDLLASLENPSSTTTETLEEGGKGPPKPAALPAPRTAQNPDRSGGLFGDNPQKTLAGLAPAGGSPVEIAGKNATVRAGVLTFTLANGAKSKPFNVARPAFMANAPQAAGIAGTWIAMEDGSKAVLFNVQADGSITGKEIPPQVAQMLMQGAAKPQ
jgi:hypothetical protein